MIMKHWKYFRYVVRHKWFVFLECCKAGIPWRGLVHDMSKFLPSEWFPYVDNFYGTEAEQKRCAHMFDKAWLFHQKHNPHHWQYWLLQKDSGESVPLMMPKKYALEMVCDWKGVPKALGNFDEGATLKWYLENQHKMKLHSITRAYVEILLKGY